MNNFETITIDGLTLPNWNTLRETTQPNAPKKQSLDGTLYVDFFNNRRSWFIQWDLLTVEQYDQIRAKYDKQFDTGMLAVTIDGLTVLMYININDKNIKYNGRYVENFGITLEEQHAIS